MKYFAILTASLALTLTLATGGFAAQPKMIGVEKQTTKRKLNKPNRRAVKKTANRSRATAPRLTRQQRREIFRKLIEIQIN